MPETTHKRILAGDIRPGDRVARARTRPFFEVAAVRPGPVAVRLTYGDGTSDRPRQTALWWLEVTA